MLSVASRMILSVITHLLTEKQELVALPEGRRYHHKYTWVKILSPHISEQFPRIFKHNVKELHIM